MYCNANKCASLGTRTGNALNYTAQTLLTVGNRPQARDVVLLITDGASQDDVVLPSRILHATGALVRNKVFTRVKNLKDKSANLAIKHCYTKVSI